MSIYCYKDLSKSRWIIYDDDSDTIDSFPFGAVVFGFISNAINMTNDGEMTFIWEEKKEKMFLDQDANIEKRKIEIKPGILGYKTSNACLDTNKYKTLASLLLDRLTTVMAENPQKCMDELSAIYEKYKWFGFFSIRGLPEALDYEDNYLQNHLFVPVWQNEKMSLQLDVTSTNIIFLGFRPFKNQFFKCFKVDDLSVFFNLDLYSLLFNRNSNSPEIRLCDYCNRIFFVTKGNNKRCPSCQKNPIIGREIKRSRNEKNIIGNASRKVLKYLDNLLHDKRIETIYIEQIRDDYIKKLDYLKLKIKGKVPINDEYEKILPIINNADDIVRWCDLYHDATVRKIQKMRKERK